MKKIFFAAAFLALTASGCSSSYQASTPTPVAQNNPTPTPSTVQATPTPTGTMPNTSPTPTKAPSQISLVLKLGNSSSIGQYLTAANGMTLYTSSSDSANTSNCTGTCASNWHPYPAPAGAQMGAALGIGGQLGTITRADGSTQVTYKNMPLYFWINDAKVGDTTGQGVGPFVVAKP